ncbi:hypothetical protein ZIOFF_043375 [Zingiber officinale]|uniref:phosphoenolpyruvate carboxykinase (ATP) n=1 Tax=Zingiber officinale TaxID=94328 RepID=A0A8J5KTY5_ZINOF|nr:hypothetical protein ZIOFF_043375 [Zingiber officinale]
MKSENGICHDDSAPPVKAKTIDELHSLQKKRSAPTTPIKDGAQQGNAAFATISEEERQKLLLQSISDSLASLTRETGPKVVRGDPARKAEATKVAAEHHHYLTPTISVSDSTLKFTHVLYNLSPPELYEQAIKHEHGSFITSTEALATLSSMKTGRSPRDKRVVKDETTANELWWGKCIRPTPEELEDFSTPDFTIYNAGQFPCNRYTHYMTTSTSIDLNLDRKEMVILGTQYAGEMKKGLFSVMNYLMPKRNILSLHSSNNMGKDGDVALFFGLSGTGKTTLSTYHNRLLIGDDEHCWSENGISNIEGGCYAKCIDLSKKKEPDIWNAVKFGTGKCPIKLDMHFELEPFIFFCPNVCKFLAVLENVVFDEHTREVDYSDNSITENTQASYPIEYIPNAKIPCVGPHPKNVILLACDAFGVLPPVSKLTLPQTMYHFISGYTALVGQFVRLEFFLCKK